MNFSKKSSPNLPVPPSKTNIDLPKLPGSVTKFLSN